MAHHFDLEEQEQLAQFKHFWETWGNLITWTVIVIMGSLAAWNGYRYWQANQAQQAVAMLDAIEVAAQSKDLGRVQQIFADLTKDYPRTAQASQAALVTAQGYANAERWKDAQGALQWVVEHAGDEGLVAIARLRLASVLIQEKSYDAAAAQLSAGFPPGFAATVADRLGDVLELQGKTQEAIAQYRRAYEALGEQLSYRQIILAKLDALGAGVVGKGGGMKLPGLMRKFVAGSAVLALSVALVACGSSKPKPAELGAVVALLPVHQAWQVQVGSMGSMVLAPAVNGSTVTVATQGGAVSALDARSGGRLWSTQLKDTLSVGVGSDGQRAAVVSTGRQLIVLEAGHELWRQTLPAQTFTAPLVAGGRVFVMTADRSVTAFDGKTGYKLWSQQRREETLVLRENGLLMAVGDTLVAGLSGRMVGFDPDSGLVRWEAPIATARGTNDVERLVELLGGVSREGEVVCARAFQAAVGCVDTTRGALLWTRVSHGSHGIDGDATALFGAQSNGIVQAWNRADGAPLWTHEQLRYRALTAPLLLGRSVVIGDDAGLVHLLSRDDGAPLNRLRTDGSGVAATPVVAEKTLVVITRQGGVYGFRPD